MKLDSLEGLSDNDLRMVIERCEELLKTRDEDRKAKALSEARTLLAAAGLSLKDVAAKGKGIKSKPAPYRGGTLYQHPADKALTWNAKGQKPGWLRNLEGQGVKPLELPATDSALHMKKPA